MREVIVGKKDYPCPVPLNWLVKEERQPTEMCILQDGNERLCFLVNINLKGIEVKTTASVLIPAPTEAGWANISMIGELNKAGVKKAFKCVSLPRIVDRIGYSASWMLVLKTGRATH